MFRQRGEAFRIRPPRLFEIHQGGITGEGVKIMTLARVPITTNTSPQIRVPLEPLRQTSRRGLLRASDHKGRQAAIACGPPRGVADAVASVDVIGRACGADDAPRSPVRRRGRAVRDLERRLFRRFAERYQHNEYESERRGEAAPCIARVAVLLWPRRPRVVGNDAAEH